MNKTSKNVLLVISLLFSTLVRAEPWIDTSNIYLKANIQLLADTGHIITPVTTYPLMWKDIIRDLNKANLISMSENQQDAYYYIKYQHKRATQSQTMVKAHVAADDSRFTSFGDTYRDANSIQVSTSFMTDNFAGKIAPSYNFDPLYGDEFRMDESYVAAFIGNWVVSFGQQDRWYGPFWDTTLSLSNNARPMPAIALSRESAEAFRIPFTEFDIPWTVTTFMGKMDDERYKEDTLLWGFRANFKPFKNVEIGLSRLAQWGGGGASRSLSTFWDMFLGKTNCGVSGVVCDDGPNPINQQAGYDIRYSMDWFSVPVSIYGHQFAEDGSENKFKFLTKAKLQLGLDANVTLFDMPTTTFIEYTDSYAECHFNSQPNCYYEHSYYQTGMRYNGRTLGSQYDNDSKTIVIGTFSQVNQNTQITNKLRLLKLNYDNTDKAPDNPIIGNPLTSIAENMIMLSTNIQHNYQAWRFTLGVDFSHSSYQDDIDSKYNGNLSMTLEYNL